MSELQLSEQLIETVQDALSRHDERANDPGITLQYLAAITGFMLANQNLPHNEKHEFLDQLYAFSQHVLDDIGQEQVTNQPPPQQEAFGIWKPDQKT